MLDSRVIAKVSNNVNGVKVYDLDLQYKSSGKLRTEISKDEGAEIKSVYKSSDPSVVTVDNNGNVTSVKQFGLKRGSATITCTVTDANGHTVKDTCTVRIQFVWWQWIVKILIFGWLWY